MKVKSIIYAGKADTYNMEVDDTHDFAVENGTIVHNCRYMCMARPIKARFSNTNDKIGYDDPLDLLSDNKDTRYKGYSSL